MPTDLIRPERLAPHPFPEGTRKLRRATGADELQINVQLEPTKPPLGVAPETEEAHLTLDEYTEFFGFDAEELASVVSYFTGFGFEVIEACAASHTVIVAGSIEEIESALSIELWIFKTFGQEHIATTDTPALPAVIAEKVAGILGLDQRPMSPPPSRRDRRELRGGGGGIFRAGRRMVAKVAKSVAKVTTSKKAREAARKKDPQPPFLPTEVAEIYDFPEHSGEGQRISILQFGGGFKPDILKTYFNKVLGYDGPSFKEVLVLSAKNDTKTYGGVEVMLDLQILGSLVPKADFTVYFAPRTMDGWTEAIRQAVYAKPTPHVISVSWGDVEANWSANAIEAIEKHLKAAKDLAITVCFSAGDNGVEPDVNGKVHVNYPASSHFALSCGGTILDVWNRRITNEVVWQGYTKATGGGISRKFPDVPEWQLPAKPCSNLSTGNAGRGVPDVSAAASPLTGYQILLNTGKWSTQGGTSAVAPLWAALVARMNGLLESRLGFLNPRLYASSSAFRQIVIGTNGIGVIPGYKAGPKPRWSACAGLGAPNGKAMLEEFRKSKKREEKGDAPNTVRHIEC